MRAEALVPALVLALLLVIPAGPVAAQVPSQPGRGERVDIVATQYPAAVVAEKSFFVDVTLRNRESQGHTVLLFAVLYRGASSTPCEGDRALMTLSRFQKSVTLGPREEARVEGGREFWTHVVNGSRLDADGPYEVCMWARLATCPREADVSACLLDFEPAQLLVRLRNTPPAVAARVDPPRGTTATDFQFTAQAGDADGDPLSYTWDFGDDRESPTPRPVHRYALPGTYTARVLVGDGFDTTEAELTVTVTGAGGAGGQNGAPGPGVLVLLAVALGVALLARGPSRRGR